jgi:hypothetical protein
VVLEAVMDGLELIMVIITFAVIIIIGRPKLEATANKKKYKAVFYCIIAVGLLFGVLDVLNVEPYIMMPIISLYKKMFKAS